MGEVIGKLNQTSCCSETSRKVGGPFPAVGGIGSSAPLSPPLSSRGFWTSGPAPSSSAGGFLGRGTPSFDRGLLGGNDDGARRSAASVASSLTLGSKKGPPLPNRRNLSNRECDKKQISLPAKMSGAASDLRGILRAIVEEHEDSERREREWTSGSSSCSDETTEDIEGGWSGMSSSEPTPSAESGLSPTPEVGLQKEAEEKSWDADDEAEEGVPHGEHDFPRPEKRRQSSSPWTLGLSSSGIGISVH